MAQPPNTAEVTVEVFALTQPLLLHTPPWLLLKHVL